MSGNGCQITEMLGGEFVRRMKGHPDLIAAVPDLHGCFRAARSAIGLIEALQLRAVFLGDYVDRGESSRETIRLLREAKERNPDWVFLLGNHELLLTQSLAIGRSTMPQENGAFEEYNGALPSEDTVFFDSLVPFFKTRNLTFIHGGIGTNPRLAVELHSVEDLVWSYGTAPGYAGPKIVCGHRRVEQPEENQNSISLETGVAFGRPLTIGFVCDAPRTMYRLLNTILIRSDGSLIATT